MPQLLHPISSEQVGLGIDRGCLRCSRRKSKGGRWTQKWSFVKIYYFNFHRAIKGYFEAPGVYKSVESTALPKGDDYWVLSLYLRYVIL